MFMIDRFDSLRSASIHATVFDVPRAAVPSFHLDADEIRHADFLSRLKDELNAARAADFRAPRAAVPSHPLGVDEIRRMELLRFQGEGLQAAVAVDPSAPRAAEVVIPDRRILEEIHFPTPPSAAGIWVDERRDSIYFRENPIEQILEEK